MPNKIDIGYGDSYLEVSYGTECPASFKDDLPDILDIADKGHSNKRKPNVLFLLKACARRPQRANRRNTLEGMARESYMYNLQCIYKLSLYYDADLNLNPSGTSSAA